MQNSPARRYVLVDVEAHRGLAHAQSLPESGRVAQCPWLTAVELRKPACSSWPVNVFAPVPEAGWLLGFNRKHVALQASRGSALLTGQGDPCQIRAF